MKAAIYARFSSDQQRSESIDAQIRAITAYCEQQKYIIVATYIDEARSATTDQRPEFQRMVADAKKHMFDVVVVHKLDRFARDRYDSVVYRRELKKNGVRLESVLERFDDSPESVVMEALMEGINEYYSRNLARETRKGLLENALAGKWTGGTPPYGYKVNRETLKLEIDEKQASAVRFYFESIAAGKNNTWIASELNRRGFKTNAGKPFTKNAFCNWHLNKRYKGIFTWDAIPKKNAAGNRNGVRRDESNIVQVEGVVPAIISVELWDRVAEIKASRKLKAGRFRAKMTWLLSEKAFCGHCGTMLRGESWEKNDVRYAYYKCRGCSELKSAPKEGLENEVVQLLLEMIYSDEGIERVVASVKRHYDELKKGAPDQIKGLEKALAESKRKINNWVNVLGEGTVAKVIIEERLKEELEIQDELEKELIKERIIKDKFAVDENKVREILKQKKNQLLSSNEEDKKLVMQESVESVIVTQRDGRFEVKLTIRFFKDAENGTRTRTTFQSLDFKSRASANSAISA